MACFLKWLSKGKDSYPTASPSRSVKTESAVAQVDDESLSSEDEDEEDVYETMDNMPMTVERGLFIGSFLAEQNIDALKAKDITHVLQVGKGLVPSHTGNFQYLQIPINDQMSEDLVAHFDKCFSFIDSAVQSGKGVLVHCMAGVSRSATVIIGYLMAKHDLDYDSAFRIVHAARPWICPNRGFREQLQQFQSLNCDLSRWQGWRPPSIKAVHPDCEFNEDDLR